MSLSKILNTLEKSWKRDDILIKIKNGLGTDVIVDEYLLKNELQIKKLNSLLRPEDIDLLNQVEQLSSCESKLINKIININHSENNETQYKTNPKNISSSSKVPSNRISSFMINWSNKIVLIVLITISAIALSKQAWA